MIHNSGGQPINGIVLLDFLATRDKTRKVKLGNRHTLCRRFGKGLACVGPSGRQNLPTIKVYQPTAGMNRVTIV